MRSAHVSSLVIAAALVSLGAVAAADREPLSPILVSYDFEKPRPTGPDSFWIREPGNSTIALSNAFRVHGERSLRLQEEAGNSDFAELLSYFPEVRTGSVFIQFYFLLADPRERFNIGLTGERWFLSREQHGQAVWVQTQDGVLVHQTADGWHPLFEPRSFTWYFLDLVYDVDKGVYHVRIDEEGIEEPVADLRDQAAWHGQTNSSVRFFSIIGDLEDEGRSDVFIDDLLVATDPAVRQLPFVAPGRRQYFVESLALGPATLDEDRRGAILDAGRAAVAEALVDVGAADRLELAADQAFRDGDSISAESWYRLLSEREDRTTRVLLKLADVAFRQGDHARERALRERFYGNLRLEGQPRD